MQAKITKYLIDKLTKGKTDQFVWDTALKGFGLKCTPTGRKIYILQYRVPGQGTPTPKRFTIGQHGTWTPDAARKEAQRLLRDISQGTDPAYTKSLQKQTHTLKVFAAQYLSDYAEIHKKPRSVAEDRRNLEKHILPVLGSRQVDKITEGDVARLHRSLRRTPIAANRCVALLSKIFELAEKWKTRPKGTNPCGDIQRYKEQKRIRYLSVEELTRLGTVLTQAERTNRHSVFVLAAFRLLILTGARLGEILSLRWDYVDRERHCLCLPDSKTGQKEITLNAPAWDILDRLPRIADHPFVLPGKRPNRPLRNIHWNWSIIRQTANLQGVRINDLRHSFASVGVGAGLGLPIIGALLGHTQATTTQRYAHLADDPLKEASDLIGQHLAQSLEGKLPKRRLRLVDK